MFGGKTFTPTASWGSQLSTLPASVTLRSAETALPGSIVLSLIGWVVSGEAAAPISVPEESTRETTGYPLSVHAPLPELVKMTGTKVLPAVPSGAPSVTVRSPAAQAVGLGGVVGVGVGVAEADGVGVGVDEGVAALRANSNTMRAMIARPRTVATTTRAIFAPLRGGFSPCRAGSGRGCVRLSKVMFNGGTAARASTTPRYWRRSAFSQSSACTFSARSRSNIASEPANTRGFVSTMLSVPMR